MLTVAVLGDLGRRGLRRSRARSKSEIGDRLCSTPEATVRTSPIALAHAGAELGGDGEGWFDLVLKYLTHSSSATSVAGPAAGHRYSRGCRSGRGAISSTAPGIKRSAAIQAHPLTACDLVAFGAMRSAVRPTSMTVLTPSAASASAMPRPRPRLDANTRDFLVRRPKSILLNSGANPQAEAATGKKRTACS